MSVRAYEYTGRDAAGARVAGVFAAESIDAATLDLRRRALFVTSIAPHRSFGLQLPSGASRRALVAFFRAFATLVSSGITIRRSLLVALRRCDDRRLAEALRSVVADVEAGNSLSDAMQRRPHDFSPLHVAMIGAGEAGGVLDDVLTRIAESLDRDHALRNRLRGALAYPAIVASAAALLSAFLLVHVVPMFAEMFAKFRVPLPWPTQILLAASDGLRSPFPWIGGAVAALCVTLLAARMRADAAVAIRMDRARLEMPLLGPMLRAAAASRILRMCAILLRSGVGVLDALAAIVPVAGSPLFTQALETMAAELRRGSTFRDALERASAFDPLTTALAAAGEEAGRLDAMLLAAACYLDGEVEAALATLGATIEPALIVVLGAVVGAIVFSIFLPLYSLIGSIA